MRLDEVIIPPTQFKVTNRFLSSYSRYIGGNRKSLRYKFIQFCLAKLRNEPVSNDYPFNASTPLAGFWHYHIVNGKIIIVYKRVDNAIRFYDIVEHSAYDNPRSAERLAAWARGIPDNAFMPLNISTLDSDRTEKLTVQQKSAIGDVIYDIIAADGFFIIRGALEHNDWRDFFEYLDHEIRDLDHQAVFAAFGGANELRQFILDAIVQLDKTQDYASL
jgi:hypothetical protein